MSFNPYDQLGIPDDADEATIRAAHKRRAKVTHPDHGGSDEAFRLVQRAYETLMDPERRARYDRDGIADDVKPDNSRPAALGLIDAHMAPLVNKYIIGGFKPEDDPRSMKVLVIITGKLEDEIASATVNIDQGRRAVVFMSDMASRLATADDSNPLAARFAAHIAAAEKSIADVNEGIRLRQLAIDIIAGYTFRQDPEQQPIAPNGIFTTFIFARTP